MCPFLFLCFIVPHFLKAKPASSSSQGKIVMAGFQPVTYSGKSTMRLTFLKVTQVDGPRACSSLTMPRAIKSGQITPSQLGRWLKVRGLHISLLLISHSFQPQRTAGCTISVANACVMVCLLTRTGYPGFLCSKDV